MADASAKRRRGFEPFSYLFHAAFMAHGIYYWHFDTSSIANDIDASSPISTSNDVLTARMPADDILGFSYDYMAFSRPFSDTAHAPISPLVYRVPRR